MLISAHDFIQMWMNVWKKVTGVTRMLIVQTLTAHILVNVISATVEMDSIVEVRPLNRNYTACSQKYYQQSGKLCDIINIYHLRHSVIRCVQGT